MSSAIVERHYAISGGKNTQNMQGVLEEIPEKKYNNIANMIKIFERSPAERSLGCVTDKTTYYNFKGSNILLENGLAQEGVAQTADNMDPGFKMIRLFANSTEEMKGLEAECGSSITFLERVNIIH